MRVVPGYEQFRWGFANAVIGIFAHEDPVRAVAERIEGLAPAWVHAMHGATIAGDALPYYTTARREQEFGYRGTLLGRPVAVR